MGIPRLASYVNSFPNLWEEVILPDIYTKLVIDGYGLCYYLYVSNGFDFRCGGQYGEFYRAVDSFFTALSSKRVKCFVIFDGADDPSDKKLETLQERAIQNIEAADALAKSADDPKFLLPPLTKDVCLQALRDLGIQFAVCDSEADAEVASLAQSLNCPVLGNDSDFFIFDVKAGYIPLSFFDWKADQLTASIFHRSKLASHFGIRAELIPLLASLAGNDYVKRHALVAFYRALTGSQRTNHFSRSEERFAKIANKLSELPDSCNQQEALESVLQMISSEDRCKLKQAVQLSLQEYNIKKSNLFDYFTTGAVCSSLRTRNGHEIKQWVLERFRSGLFSTKFMNSLTSGKCLLRVQVENCQEISANRSSLRLRQFVYGILNDIEEGTNEPGNLPSVQEWDRAPLPLLPPMPLRTELNQFNVAPYQENVVPGISHIPYLETTETLNFLLFALYSADTPEIEALPQDMKLFAASLRYLLNHAQPKLKMNHLLALLCCCVNLQDNLAEENVKTQSIDLRAAHSFCQWQSVLGDAINLNRILREPVLTPYIHKIYNGKMAHSLAKKLNQGNTPEELIPSSKQQLFNQLKTAVTKDVKHVETDCTEEI
ncbi:unnamed protein product [Porites evermanni]|uniref:Asteroid domain-containing protein n=1 Tax=Porites evermanni TaxID=104178 RepID=A0ABN8LDS1_9CNID|nr:unnamed protein product [Porites evermanni]